MSVWPYVLCLLGVVERFGRPLVDFRPSAQVVSVVCELWVSLSFVLVRSAVVCLLPLVLLLLCVGVFSMYRAEGSQSGSSGSPSLRTKYKPAVVILDSFVQGTGSIAAQLRCTAALRDAAQTIWCR